MSTATDNVADHAAPNSNNEAPNGTTEQTTQAEAAPDSADEKRRLYIGNVAYSITEGELKEFFSKYTV